MSSSSDRPISRSSFTSTHSTHSTTSPPRLSIDKRHQPDRRLSTDSTIRTHLPSLPGITSLPGISHTSPLAAAGPRGIPPPTPPKDRLPPPQTPTRKPVQRQKSPLSSEAFSSASPAPSMPGAFPVTPSPGPPVGLPPQSQFNTTAYAANSSPATSTPDGKTPGKRTSSLRGFFPFKSLRRSYDNTSPDTSPHNGPGRPSSAFGMRPITPGGESMASKSTNPSLRKKMSGTFWKRKSSLGIFGGVKGDDAASLAISNGGRSTYNGSPANGTNGVLHEEVEDSRSATPVPGDEIQGVKKRKSGTFWRRKSSSNLLGENNAGLSSAPTTNGNGNAHHDANQYGNSSGNGNGNGDVVMGGTQDYTGYNDDWKHGENGVAHMRTRTRSISPPPQIPAFIGGGGGLGLEAEDMFKDIH